MIFLDNASTTKIRPEAISEIERSHALFYNPSALSGKSLEVRREIDGAKQKICKALGVDYNNNLIITGSATEADNLAIFGSAKKTGDQFVFGAGEHQAVFASANELKLRGYNVVFAPLNKFGEVDLDKLKEILQKPTAFVSIMHVSNETGAINDISKISRLVKNLWPNAIFHSDGVQAFGKIQTNVLKLGVDLYSISGHKVGGPKGIGALYVKNIAKLKPIIFGGGQEFGIRSGTENTAYILALSKVVGAFEIEKNFEYVKKLSNIVRTYFEGKDGITINSSKSASPYILSLSFEGIRGETLVHILEEKGVIVGTGSACSSKKTTNRTLEAIGLSREQIEGAIRISFSHENKEDEVLKACEIIEEGYKTLLEKLR